MKHIQQLLFVFLGTWLANISLKAQVLHTENFNVVIDSSKVLEGNFTPDFRLRNVKGNYIEIENTADVSLRIKKNAFTIANKYEFSKLGDEEILSGGFLYLEYINLTAKAFSIEPFYQMHWNEIRGLKNKYAGGVNLRWRAITKNNTGLYFGLGSFYEYELWNYSGVKDENLPKDQSRIVAEEFRGNFYVSFKQRIGEVIDLDVSGYYQPAYSNIEKKYRLASSFEVTYNITKFLGIRLLYQNIYDPSPLVPIEELYNDINFGFTISF